MAVTTYDPVRERVRAIVDAMTPDQRANFSVALNAAIRRNPLGPQIRARAIAETTGLGEADLSTALTNLASSALKIGGDIYSQQQDAKAASSAAKRDVALQMAQMQAVQAQTAAQAASHRKLLTIIGVGVGVTALLGVTGFIAVRRLRG